MAIEAVDLGGGFRAIRGYRVWQLALRRSVEAPPDLLRRLPGAFYEPELRGVIYPAPWTPGEFSPAECRLCPPEYQKAPMHGFDMARGVIEYAGGTSAHRHGWYAFSSFRMAMDYFATLLGMKALYNEAAGWVVGSCLLAGKVVRADRGYRATHAALEAIVGPEPGAIFVLRAVRANNPEEIYELLRNPPLAEMDWPFEADYPVWVIEDFRELFDQALIRVRGEMVRAARRGKALEVNAGAARRYWEIAIL